jgi:Fe-S-cluster containining protein
MLPILNCEGCGACCWEIGTPPFTGIGDDVPPPWLEWDVNEHDERRDQRLPCIWYDARTRLCRHYEYRPEICRDFDVGCFDCREFRQQCGIDRT